MQTETQLQKCPICLEIVDLTANVCTTICKHSFHLTCFMQLKSNNCPMCRAELAKNNTDNDAKNKTFITFVGQDERYAKKIIADLRSNEDLTDAEFEFIRDNIDIPQIYGYTINRIYRFIFAYFTACEMCGLNIVSTFNISDDLLFNIDWNADLLANIIKLLADEHLTLFKKIEIAAEYVTSFEDYDACMIKLINHMIIFWANANVC